MEIDSNSDSGASSGSRITFGGLASGIDTRGIVDALLDVEAIPLERLRQRQAEFEEEQGLFRELNSLLSALRDAARGIDNRNSSLTGASFDEELLALTATSSDPGVLTAEVDDGAALSGSFDVRVTQLATVSRRVSTAYASETDTVGKKNDDFSIDFGGAETIDIDITKDTTLADLRDAINLDAANNGAVRADLLDDGVGGIRLILSGTETGTASDLIVTTDLKGVGSDDFLDASLGQDAQDANLVVLGVPITRSSNEITDAINGLTLRLEGVNDLADPTDHVTITLGRDDDEIVSRIEAFVEAYNQVREFAERQALVDAETERAGPLSGDFGLRFADRTVQRVISSGYNTGGTFQSLGSIGLRFDGSGRLTLDRGKLTAALDEDAADVRALFSGDGTSDGVATAMARSLESLVRSGDGVMASRIKSIDRKVKRLETDILAFETYLERREEDLLRRFSALESLVSGLLADSDFLSSFGQNK